MTEDVVKEDVTLKNESRAGKYLTFSLADEEYGIEILRVREIIGIMEITTVPRTPHYVKGVINLRGRVIPVIDLRLKFELESMEFTRETCIIVVEVNEVLTGIIVDRVSEVLDIEARDIEDPPSFGTNLDTEFILGMGKAKDKVTMLLDVTKVLANKELEMPSNLS